MTTRLSTSSTEYMDVEAPFFRQLTIRSELNIKLCGGAGHTVSTTLDFQRTS